MARLIVFFLLACTLAPAWADPGELVKTALVVTALLNPGTWLAAGSLLLAGVISNSEARRKASASADAALASYNASLQDRNVTVLRNDSPWQIVYGSPAPVGGSLVAMLTSGPTDNFKHLVIVFAAHECQAIDEVYIEGDPVGLASLGPGGAVTGGAFYDTAPRAYVQIHLSPGGADTADASLISNVPGYWTSAHKLSGYTYIVLTLDLFMSRFQGGPPNVTAKLRGKKIYDYRTSTTAYSTNPALCVADFLTSVYGYSASSGQIDTAAAIAAANACDSQGFNCNGALSTDQSRETNLHALEDSMAGRTHWSGGVWRIMAGAWSTPVMALTDANLAAPIEVTQAGNPRASRYNSVRGKYIPAAQLGVTVDFTPYVVSSYVTADGPNQWLDVSYGFTASNSECQKLAAIAVERSRAGLTINYPAHLTAWKLQPGDRVYVTNNELGFSAKTFRVVDWTHINNSPLGLVLTEDTASMYTGTFSVADPLAATSNLANPFARPVAPSNLTANSGTAYLVKLGDGTIQTRVYCTWNASTQRAVLQGGYAQIQWKVTGDPDANFASIDLSPDASSAMLTGPKDGSNITVRVRYITGVGSYGDWATVTHAVLGKTDPPTTVTGVAITQELAIWQPVTDIDVAGYQIRAVPGTSAVWSLGVAVHDGLVTDSPYPFKTRLSGVTTIMVAAEDTTGHVGVPGYATLDFGVITTLNIAQGYDYQANAFPGPLTTNAAVSAGVLVANADPSVDFWSIGADDWWTHDGAADFYGGSAYLAMTYTATFTPAYGGGSIILDTTLLGSRSTIEWRTDGATLGDFWDIGPGASDFWSGTDFYGAMPSFQPYIGEVQSVKDQGIQWRVSIDGGPIQGQITAMSVRLQMPQLSQVFTAQSIGSGGTRLAPAGGAPALTWIAVEQVDFTIFVDGSGAVAGRVLDFNPTLGPLVQTINSAGTAVSSTGQSARVSGY